MFYLIVDNNIQCADYKFDEKCKEYQSLTMEEYTLHPNKVVVYKNKLVLNPNYEQEEAEKEKERIANLTQTRANVWRSLIQARMITKQFVKDEIEKMPEETQEEKMAKEIARIDVDDVEDFHRGHSLVNYIGGLLNITSENLDLFFETGDYHYLETQESEE